MEVKIRMSEFVCLFVRLHLCSCRTGEEMNGVSILRKASEINRRRRRRRRRSGRTCSIRRRSDCQLDALMRLSRCENRLHCSVAWGSPGGGDGDAGLAGSERHWNKQQWTPENGDDDADDDDTSFASALNRRTNKLAKVSLLWWPLHHLIFFFLFFYVTFLDLHTRRPKLSPIFNSALISRLTVVISTCEYQRHVVALCVGIGELVRTAAAAASSSPGRTSLPERKAWGSNSGLEPVVVVVVVVVVVAVAAAAAVVAFAFANRTQKLSSSHTIIITCPCTISNLWFLHMRGGHYCVRLLLLLLLSLALSLALCCVDK